MDRRGADLLAQRPQAGDERRPRGVAVGLWRDQQPRTGHGRERHRDLELRIVAPAGALVGVGPAVVEDVLALAMGLRVAGRRGDDLAGPPASTRICTGCQPERPPTQPESSSADRKACETKGLWVSAGCAGRVSDRPGWRARPTARPRRPSRQPAIRTWTSSAMRLTRGSCLSLGAGDLRSAPNVAAQGSRTAPKPCILRRERSRASKDATLPMQRHRARQRASRLPPRRSREHALSVMKLAGHPGFDGQSRAVTAGA